MIGLETAAEASAAIREVGFIAQLKKPASAATPQNPFPNPDEPAPEPPDAPAPLPVWIVVDAYSQRHIDGELIRAQDKKVMMEAAGSVPTQGDILTISGQDHAILSVMPLAPSGVALMFECQCRR